MVARSVRLALALFVLAPVSVAQAIVPGHWDPVTAANGVNIDQVATVRTPDGYLHVIWHHHSSASTDALVQTLISPNGTVGAPQPIASGWAGIGDAVILRDNAGRLVVFAGATRSADTSDPLQSLAQWTSADNGGTWALTPTAIVNNAGFTDPLGGALGPDGAIPFFAWTTTDGVFVHRGSDPPTTSTNLQESAGFACCGYDPGVALDSSTGAIVVAWYALVNQGDAVYARTIDRATNTPTGSTLRMPRTLDSVAPDQRVGLTGRPGKPGVYAAYNGTGPSQSSVVVWRFGAAGTTTVAKDNSTELRDPTITATSDGRLWVAWSAKGRIWARRSNLNASQWGAVTSIPVRHGTGTVYKLALNATTGPLDVFGGFAPQSGSGVQTWHSQILPGLTLTVSPTKLSLAKGKKGTLKLTVTDAGAPVQGAKVSLAGHSAKTNKNGTAKLKVGPISATKSFTIAATRSGYATASVRIRVRLK